MEIWFADDKHNIMAAFNLKNQPVKPGQSVVEMQIARTVLVLKMYEYDFGRIFCANNHQKLDKQFYSAFHL